MDWNVQIATRVATSFAQQAGLSGEPFELVSFRQNALFHFSTRGMTVRIYSPLEDPSRAALMVRLAEALESHAFPAVRLWHDVGEQPVNVLGYGVSAWQWIEQVKRTTDTSFEFGRLMRCFHELDDVLAVDIPAFDPMIKIRRRIERLRRAEGFPSEYVAVLDGAVHVAEERAASLRDTVLGVGLIHGDALRGNTVSATDGLKLIDFDSVCFGPREWDLVPSWISVQRFGRDRASWHAVLDGYGIDEKALGRLDAANVVKQLSMTVVLCLKHGECKAVDSEIARRMSQWKCWDFDSRWYTPLDVGNEGKPSAVRS